MSAPSLANEHERASALDPVRLDEARRHSVSLGFYNGRIYAWAPTAASPELQLQCERSFTRAVRQNLNAITALADPRSSLSARPRSQGD